MSTTRRIHVAPATDLFTEIWPPAGDVERVVVISHGQGEYVSRYAELAADLNRGGALVFGPDHRGQGRSSGPMGHIECFEDYAADLVKVADAVAAELPASQKPGTIPWFVFGHSMGALVALIFALEYERSLPLSGIVVTNPMLVPSARGAATKALVGRMLVKLSPKLPVPIKLDRSLLFRDSERLEKYRNDNTGFEALTPGFGRAFAAAVERVRREARTIVTPMLWCVGTGDRIIAPQPTIDLFRSLPPDSSRDRTLEIFNGYYHEMHNEPPRERQRFMSVVTSWVGERS